MPSSLFCSVYGVSSVCPCAVTPGGLLFGELADEPISDWNETTANQENLCQIQIWAGIDHIQLT